MVTGREKRSARIQNRRANTLYPDAFNANGGDSQPNSLLHRGERFALECLHLLHMIGNISIDSFLLNESRSGHEGLFILDEITGVSGINLGVKPRVHPYSVNRASLDAISTINAKKSIDFVAKGEFFNLWIVVLCCLNVNAAAWAGRSTKKT